MRTKICGPAFTKLGLNVARNEMCDIYSAELVQLYQQGVTCACSACLARPVVTVCGGGYVPHRYSSKNGFANASVYCRDLMKLITHVRDRVLESIPEQTRKKLHMRPLSYDEVRDASLSADFVAGELRA